MTGISASPNTPWTAGQYVVRADTGAADQGKTHWNGTAWVSAAALAARSGNGNGTNGTNGTNGK